jgi:hypothetical protein
MEEKSYKLINVDTSWEGQSLQFSLKKLEITNYSNNHKSICNWEFAKKTKCSFSPQVICCIPFLKTQQSGSDLSEEISVILVEKYRIPVDKKVIEFPSFEITDHSFESYIKMIDLNLCEKLLKNEGHNQQEEISKFLIESCVKELKTSTGYTVNFKTFMKSYHKYQVENSKFHKNIYFSPWISDESLSLALFEIDRTKEENMKNVNKNEIFEVKLNDLLDFLINKINQEGFACSAPVFFFALGLRLKDVLKEYIN